MSPLLQVIYVLEMCAVRPKTDSYDDFDSSKKGLENTACKHSLPIRHYYFSLLGQS